MLSPAAIARTNAEKSPKSLSDRDTGSAALTRSIDGRGSGKRACLQPGGMHTDKKLRDIAPRPFSSDSTSPESNLRTCGWMTPSSRDPGEQALMIAFTSLASCRLASGEHAVWGTSSRNAPIQLNTAPMHAPCIAFPANFARDASVRSSRSMKGTPIAAAAQRVAGKPCASKSSVGLMKRSCR